jgi:hypothetical protein
MTGLYRWLPIEALQKLQKISATLNIYRTNVINNDITRRRESAKAGAGFDKAETLRFVDFLEKEFSEVRKLLNEFIAAI